MTVTGRHTKSQPWMRRASIAGFLDIYRRLKLRVLDGFSIESYEKKPQELSFTDTWFGCLAMGISG